jgi:acetyl-CoA acyltransferase 1
MLADQFTIGTYCHSPHSLAMASQSSFDDMSTPTESNPSTPQPLDFSLPSSQDIPQAMSATTSMMVAPSSAILGEASLSQGTMTPPPSSQQPAGRFSAVSPRATPDETMPSMLSSPPPTAKGARGSAGALHQFNLEQLSERSPEDLQNLLKTVMAENRKLEAKVAESRMNAAHYKLQHNLLTIETEEAALRAEVEHEMTKREVQVLTRLIQGPESQVGREYIERLRQYGYAMRDANIDLQTRLERAKKMIVTRDDEIEKLIADKEMLITRIRENRQHLNLLRSPGGIFHIPSPKLSSHSYPATPQQHRSTPKHTPMTGRSVRRDHSQEPFAALLLADRVLSQENNNSAPSTPTVSRRQDPHTPSMMRHNRGVHSLSSLQNTPGTVGTARPSTANSTLLPSVQFTSSSEQKKTYSPMTFESAARERERRRKSRDSTISASDAEEVAREVSSSQAKISYREESEEVQESQASQTASEMLRIDPRESFEVAASRTTTPAGEKVHHVQSKIVAGVTKRKHDGEDYSELVAKKAKAAEGVGLGIGFERL